MKTNPISIRFNKEDLALAQNLSGIKKPQKLVDTLISEYVKPLKSKLVDLPKDYMSVENISTITPDGKIEPLIKKKVQQPVPIKNIRQKPLTISECEEIPPMPTRKEGEDALEFAARKNEWKKKYKQ